MDEIYTKIEEFCKNFKTIDQIKEHLEQESLLEDFSEELLDEMVDDYILKRKYKELNHPNQQFKRQQKTDETKQTRRILEMLNMLNNNQKISIYELIEKAKEDAEDGVENYWVNSQNKALSEKSIRRDIDIVRKFFPLACELISGEKGCYKAITKQAFENFMTPEVLSLMALTFSMASKSDLFDNFDLDEDDKKIVSKELKKINEVYEFKNKPFESTSMDRNILRVLERSIETGKCITVEYPTRNGMEKIKAKPYKILFMSENFYLACESEQNEEYRFSLYRISKIKTIEETSKTYQKNLELVEFIKDIQTPFAVYKPGYKKYLIEVKVRVSREKAFFFTSKKHLKSQQIVETKEDGSLIVSFRVSQEMEMENLIKSWLPHMKVLEPLSLKEKIEKELREYLKTDF